jgi:hypothetical protein
MNNRTGALALGLLGMWPGGSWAQADWTPLDAAAIRAALTDRTLVYDAAWQSFRASGRTLYNAGHDSWGYWTVRGDRYCSQWPPADDWTCYDIERKGAVIRFVGAGGDVTEGRYK